MRECMSVGVLVCVYVFVCVHFVFDLDRYFEQHSIVHNILPG